MGLTTYESVVKARRKSASLQVGKSPTGPLAHLYHRRVVQSRQDGVVEMLQEQMLHQFVAQLAAGAVGK